jgi:hypothetical protein
MNLTFGMGLALGFPIGAIFTMLLYEFVWKEKK